MCTVQYSGTCSLLPYHIGGLPKIAITAEAATLLDLSTKGSPLPDDSFPSPNRRKPKKTASLPERIENRES